jgi:hypothetical protein
MKHYADCPNCGDRLYDIEAGICRRCGFTSSGLLLAAITIAAAVCVAAVVLGIGLHRWLR